LILACWQEIRRFPRRFPCHAGWDIYTHFL
jgi:hypothetical protein